ncbi:hypothetical protein [Virgibacillus kimchii]
MGTQVLIWYTEKNNRLVSHEGLGIPPSGTFPGKEVMLMGMNDVLTLMISFGMLIALVMSDKNE